MKPKVGDIWYNQYRNYHYLILEEGVEMGMGRTGYAFVVMEKDFHDRAYIQHFHAQCSFIS